MKIAAIAGSNANHSYNRLLLEYMARRYADQDQFDVIDIRPVPMFNESFKGDLPQAVRDMDQRIQAADAVIIASPEYNHSITSALKSTIEWLSYKVHPLNHKPVWTTGASTLAQGTSRSQVQLRDILISPGLNASLCQMSEFFLSDVCNEMDADGNLTNPGTIKVLDKCMNEFRPFAKAINHLEEEMNQR